MKVIERAVTPDGVEIQLEDWSEHNSTEYPELYGLTIGAYPTAQRTGKSRLVEGGRTFRLTIANNAYAGYTNEQVKTDFESLKTGKKVLGDLSTRFWYGEKDMWYLGMAVPNNNY
jgi:methylmalonyl-CoA mutase N-terminal domain/subunit